MSIEPVSITIETLGLVEQLYQSWRDRGAEQLAKRRHEESEKNAERRHAHSESNADSRQVVDLAEAQRRHDEFLAQQRHGFGGIQRALDNLLEAEADRQAMSRQEISIMKAQTVVQQEQLTAFENHSWAVFRQTPEGSVYRSWERAAIAMLDLVHFRDAAMADAASTEVALRPPPQRPHQSIVPPQRPTAPPPLELPELESEPKQVHFTKFKYSFLWLEFVEDAFDFILDHVGILGLVVALAFSALSGSSAVGVHLHWESFQWATVLTWWGWLIAGLALVVFIALLFSALLFLGDRKVLDTEAFDRACAAHARKLTERQAILDRAALQDSNFRSLMDSYAVQIERFSAAEHAYFEELRLYELAVRREEQLAETIAGLDWCADSGSARRYIKAISQMVSVGRRAQPAPEELPPVVVPRSRLPSDALTSRQRALLESFRSPQ